MPKHWPRPTSKAGVVAAGIATTGLTIEEIMKLTGWNRQAAHSVINTDLRNRYHMNIVRNDAGRYRLANVA